MAGLLTAGAAEPTAAEVMDDGPSNEQGAEAGVAVVLAHDAEPSVDAMDVVAPDDLVSTSAMMEIEPVPEPTTTTPTSASVAPETSTIVETGLGEPRSAATAENSADMPATAAPESVPTSSEPGLTASVVRRVETMAGRIVAHVLDTYRERSKPITAVSGEAAERAASHHDAEPARWLPRTVKRAVTAVRARGRSLLPWRKRTDDGSAGPSG